jgi:hypothetical protein
MSYGKKLKNPGLKDNTPEGRTSYQGALKQVEGNLRWSLTFLDPDEIIVKLVEVFSEELDKKNFSSPEKRLRFLRGLREFHDGMLEDIDEEIDHIQRVMAKLDEEEVIEAERCKP